MGNSKSKQKSNKGSNEENGNEEKDISQGPIEVPFTEEAKLGVDYVDTPLECEDIMSRSFYPRSAQNERKIPNKNQLKINMDDETYLNCYYKDKGTKNTLVFYHGNGELIEGYLKLPEDSLGDIPFFLNTISTSIILSEYRGYGNSTGKICFARLVYDVRFVAHYTKSKNLENIIMGRSLGSLAAIEFSNINPNIKGLIIESGLALPQHRIGGWLKDKEIDFDLDLVSNNLFNHKGKLENFKNPLLILHTLDDKIIPVYNALLNFIWSIDNVEFDHINCDYSDPKVVADRLLELIKEYRVEGDETYTTYSCGNKTLVLFASGDHNYIWPMNWSVYSSYVNKMLKL